jgi:hypothetical protein
MESKFVWLASYPKSGNTWFRSFLTALETGEVNINELSTGGIFSAKQNWEEVLDTDFDDLGVREYQRLRKLAVLHMAKERKRNVFLKIHDAYSYATWDGLPLVPEVPGGQALYLVRNPLDVALSLANHNGQSIDKTIDHFICKEEAGFVKTNKAGNQSHQLLGTWSLHAQSWIFQDKIPVTVVRYEDMKSSPTETFSEALRSVGLNYSIGQVEKALAMVEFEKLREQEERAGFREKPHSSMRFFNQGKSGRWKEELSVGQVQKIMNCNERMMKYFGYWSEASNFLTSKRGKQDSIENEPTTNQPI